VARGGRRPGSGAPKGNKNAFRTGNRTSDIVLRTVWRSLTPEQQETMLPFVRKAGGLPSGLEASNVTPISHARRLAPSTASPQFTHTHTDTQSNNQSSVVRDRTIIRERTIIGELVGMGFFNAAPFVERHRDVLEVVEQLLAEMRQVDEDDPNALVGLQSRPANLKSNIHAAVAIKVGRLWQCPYCPWMQFRLIEQSTG